MAEQQPETATSSAPPPLTHKLSQGAGFPGVYPDGDFQMIPTMYPTLVPANPGDTNPGPGVYAVPVAPFTGPAVPNHLIPLTFNIPTRPAAEARAIGDNGHGLQQLQQLNQADPQRQVVAGRFQIALQLDLLLMLKLAAVVFLFNQDGSIQRLVVLVFVASLVYLYQSGAIEPLGRWLSQSMQRATTPPRLLQPARAENFPLVPRQNENENGAVAGQGAPEGQAGAVGENCPADNSNQADEASRTDGPNRQKNKDDLSQTSASSLRRLQFRSDLSKAKWNKDLCLAEVVEKKGKMWVSMGIACCGKTFCFIEETLYLVEIGALLLMDNNDTVFTLDDVYGKVTGGECGCCWELYEAYRNLKSLGYIVGHHGVSWSVKGVNQSSVVVSVRGTKEDVDLNTQLEEILCDLLVDELRPVFDVYLPNSKFRKSSPGDPAFILCLVRGNPPTKARIEALEQQCGGVPLKLCHVDHSRVSFFSFEKVELPVLP